jgi:hypothetical protein
LRPKDRPTTALALCAVLLSCREKSASSSPAPSPAPTASTKSDPAVRFRLFDQAKERGLVASNHCGDPTNKRYALEEIGQGCALFDMDGDGDLDAFLVDACGLVPPPKEHEGDDWTIDRKGRCALYANDGRGHFTDVTEGSGAGLELFGQGVVAADYDDDGDVDLYVTCWGANRLLQNDGKGRFTDVTEKAGVGDPRWSVAAVFFDADGDQDLDLYVGNYFAMSRARDPDCWRKVDCPYFEMKAACGPKGMVPEPDSFFVNNGDGTFTDASESSGVRAVRPKYSLGIVAFDYDQDGDQDLFVGNDSRGNYLFENDGHGHFTETADLAGCSLSSKGLEQASMGIACGDFDGDLDLDLYCTTFSHDDKTLFQNDGHGGFLDVTRHHDWGVATWFSLGWGDAFVDFDQDGWLDLFEANGHVHPAADRRAPELSYKQRCRVQRNENAHFRDVTESLGDGFARKASFRGAAFGDVDEDGDEDVLVVALDEPPSLFVTEPDASAPPSSRHWLTLELEQEGRNRFAIGARVVAKVGERRLLRVVQTGGSFASASDPRLHFGLGAAASVDSLTVTWPDGSTQTVAGPVAGDRKLRWRKGASPEPRVP